MTAPTPAPDLAGLVELRRLVERALDRNGLAEAGWTEEAIDAAMAEVSVTSDFSRKEAGVVMPIFEAAIRDLEAENARLVAALEQIATGLPGTRAVHRLTEAQRLARAALSGRGKS